MSELTDGKNASTEKRKKLTEEEKKTRQREHARAWYERKKAAAGKSGGTKKPGASKKPGSSNKKVKGKKQDGLFLYWKNKKDDMFQEVQASDAETDAHEIFMQNPKLEEIYLMQPAKRYSRPTLVVTDLKSCI